MKRDSETEKNKETPCEIDQVSFQYLYQQNAKFKANTKTIYLICITRSHASI